MTRSRRQYQSWVANESLEDYALRYAASSYRRWSPAVVANTALGGISFLGLEAIGANITLSYGFGSALAAVLAVSLLIFLVSQPIAYWCAASNVDIDLLTRGAGFGYIGSTLTSLIYAAFTLIFFAIETAIWAQALQLGLGLNLALGYVICSLVILPIVFFGVTWINRLQAWTQPLWLLMMLLPLLYIVARDPQALRAWVDFHGRASGGSGFDLLTFGAASGVLFALIAQIGEQADYLRFLPARSRSNRRAWWGATVAAGPGWIVIGGAKILAGGLLAVLALRMGSTPAQATEPVRMYYHAWQAMTAAPALALGLAVVFVSVSQLKINVTNAYSGSLAWSNVFVRLAHFHPGRVVWLVFNVVVALLLALLGIFATLQLVLSVYATTAIAWIGALVADLVVLKRSGISPPYIEFKRAHLYNINPVGCGAMALATLVGVLAYAGLFGSVAAAFFGYITLATAFCSAVAIGYATGGRYYLARPDLRYRDRDPGQLVQCCICEREYETPDMTDCPFYRGPICSLCCGLDLHCHDLCKQPQAAPRPQAAAEPLPAFQPHVLRRVGRFLGLFAGAAALLGAAFVLTYRLMGLHLAASSPELVNVLWRLYLAILVLVSLAVWWIVLFHEGTEQAERDLLESMDDLDRARRHLVESEKLAALGGLVAGVAHEINTPAGIAISTASFLGDRTRDAQVQFERGSLDTQAQAQYLRDATESARLLQSNAQRIGQLVRNFKQLGVDQITEPRRRFDLRAQIEQVLRELAPRLKAARVEVRLDMPAGVELHSYAVSLEQVITNLVINSLQHAFANAGGGQIDIQARVDEDSVELHYSDSGPGIEPALRGRVFEPFFTTQRMAGGSGLGLYIVHQVVTRQLGGTVELAEPAWQGAHFVLRIPRMARHALRPGTTLRQLGTGRGNDPD
ncbi:ATP-binding protein [Thiomonas sp. FB-6]|uniref:ATP-binding protein n=1 Tax=Thiomonas sp. FB-6 TaxID=1158291 RepID=UPI0003734B2F|nr:ATP-binding protein [Thiomonas sp. FB-6]